MTDMLIISPPPPITPTPTPAAPTITMAPCSVKQSRNAGGFVWASCTITASDLTSPVSVTYKASLPTFDPGTLGPWRKQTGTLGFATGEISSIKFAFKGNRSVAQVRKVLKVTLSNPTGGATVAYAPAS